MALINGVHYKFIVGGAEFETMDRAEDHVEDLISSDYDAVDYRFDYGDDFFSECEMRIEVWDENNNCYTYSEFYEKFMS